MEILSVLGLTDSVQGDRRTNEDNIQLTCLAGSVGVVIDHGILRCKGLYSGIEQAGKMFASALSAFSPAQCLELFSN